VRCLRNHLLLVGKCEIHFGRLQNSVGRNPCPAPGETEGRPSGRPFLPMTAAAHAAKCRWIMCYMKLFLISSNEMRNLKL
jgi:hypothetical protein